MISRAHSAAARKNGELHGGAKRRPLHEATAAFWSRVRKGHADACWIWLGSADTNGYGRFGFGGKIWQAHRFAFFICRRSPSDTEKICHSCDTPSCVNPAHLFAGTTADNNADCRSKGRASPPPTNTKATAVQVLAILREYKPHVMTQPMLATKYNLTLPCVRSIIHDDKAWRAVKSTTQTKD